MRLSSRPRRAIGALAVILLLAALLLGLEGPREKSRLAPGLGDAPLRQLEAVLDRNGLAAALDSLERLATRDSAVLRDGHQIAHALGRDAVARHGGDASVIQQCSPSFASGCYHGVVEAAMRPDAGVDMSHLERLCLSVQGSGGPAPGFECLHGLGHGILGAVDHDLAAALRHCDALSTPRHAASCHSGAFMEAITGAMGTQVAHDMSAPSAEHAQHAVQRLAIDPGNPFSPCDRYRDPYAASCWLFQGYLILRANAFDARRALRTCDGAPDDRAPRCYESIGHQLTGLFQHGDAWILGKCAEGSPALAGRCAGGATLALDAMDWSGRRAARFCAAAPTAWKEACYRAAAGALVDLATPAQRAALCASVEVAYVRTCREAGGVL